MIILAKYTVSNTTSAYGSFSKGSVNYRIETESEIDSESEIESAYSEHGDFCEKCDKDSV